MKIPEVFIPETKSDERLGELLKKHKEKKRLSFRKPRVSQDVYMPDAYYLDHTTPVFLGGLYKVAQVQEVAEDGGKKTIFLQIEERPNCWYNWNYLQIEQAELKKKYL